MMMFRICSKSRSRCTTALILAFLLIPLLHSAYAQEWVHKLEQNGIVLYESASENEKERNFMAVFTIAASLKSCISLLYHPRFHPSFMDGIATSELIGSPHSGSVIFYQVIDLPWPIPNRDMVTQAHFAVSSDLHNVTVIMKSAPAEKEPTSMTRVIVPDREWRFQKEDENKTHVVYYYASDENIPSFLHQLLSVDGPLKMLSRFRQIAEEKGHILPGLAWIEE